MQVSYTQITVTGTSEEVARLFPLQPETADSLTFDVQPARPTTPGTVTGHRWSDFRAMQTGKTKELLELLIENKGKVSGEKVKTRLSMQQQLQINGIHATLNANARKVTGESHFLRTNKTGKYLYYSIRPEILSQLGG